ncbi:SWI/SNF complex subunit [Chlorella vulgaris]
MVPPVVAVGKRNGNVQHELVTSEEHLKQLEPLLARLNERATGPKFDRKNLAALLAGLQQFMEDALGVNALYKQFMRLPAHLLRDYSPDGPLFIIGAACADFMLARNLKRIDWIAPNFRTQYVELFGRIRSELLRSGYVRTPLVYVHPSNGAAVSKLQETVRSLKAEVAQSAGGSVTHVLYPFGAAGDPDDGQHRARTLEVKGASARVHWLYLPDSYDEWVPATATAGVADPPHRPPRGPWHVYARWLTDSEKYNEWMNPADYETPEAAEEAKRKRETGDAGEDRRKGKAARMAGPLPEIQRGLGEAVAEGVTKQRVLLPNSQAMQPAAVTDVSQGQRPAHALMPNAAVQVPPALLERLQQLQQQQQQQGDVEMADAEGTRQQHGSDGPLPQQQQQQQQQGLEPYLVPACAAWFRWDGIAEVEAAHFKDFLGLEGGNAERYRQYRNAIINKYREDPSRELSFTEARRALVGDVNLLRRVWKFLASWQLINFLARRAPQSRGAAVLRPTDTSTAATPGGREGVAGMRTSGADALYAPPQRASVEQGAVAALMGSGSSGSGSARVRNTLFGGWARQPALASKAEFYCRGAECGTLCTALRHHCLTQPDLNLCPKCFKEGRFPANTAARDFIRLEAADAVPDESGWTDQETLLLLEGIQRYGESWQQVAEHVGSKNALQCVSRFLQLPSDDALLADAAPGPHTQGLVAIPPPGQDSGLSAASAVLEEVIPFAEVANPVLAQVSFLAQMVGPKIASAAAQRALEVLAEEDAEAAAAVAAELAAGNGGGAADNAGAQQTEVKPANGSNGADGPPSAGRMRLAAATGLAAAAVQAKLLADQEEREVQRLVLAAVESQFKKVQAKLQYLEELDGLMAAERLTLEAMRGRLIDDYQQAVAENAKAGLAPPPGRALASEAATAEASEPSAAAGPAEQQGPAAMQ